jgi:sensor histidine kinase regulating citrate/malate metabolism
MVSQFLFKKRFTSLTATGITLFQRQLVLGIALVHAVLMTIFILDLTERERHFLQKQSVQQAIALSEMLAANSSSWVLASDVVGLSEILSYQKRYPGLDYSMVISERGQVLAHTNAEFIGRYLNDEISYNLLNSEANPRHKYYGKPNAI